MKKLLKTILTDLENIENIKKDIGYFYLGIPDRVDNKVLDSGMLCLRPDLNTSVPITTGIKEQNDIDLKIIVAKQMKNKNYRNAQETGDEFMMRVIEDTDENNSLKTNTIKYTLRQNIRNYGKKQNDMSITYDSQEFTNAGVITATINLSVVDIYNINLS